ncbi:MAG: peptide-binding protein [Candidatus Saccharimonadales bacterium]
MKTRLSGISFKRRVNKSQKQFEDLGVQAEQNIDKLFYKRFKNLVLIRRFLISWLGLFGLLIIGLIVQNLNLGSYYQSLKTVPGGTYNEGVHGRFTNASPIFATTDADTTVSRLIFSGLFSYDHNGKFVGDLASGYSVEDHGTKYIVRLKPKLVWQDGKILNSSDVLFTYQTIQNPDTHSPLLSSWQGVTVTAPDSRTIVFRLPGELASFPLNLVNGIIPRHILAKVPVANLRIADFNSVNPIGSGPFKWHQLQVNGNGDPKNSQEQIALIPFKDYIGGEPKLQKFVVNVFADQKDLVKAFRSNQLTAIEGDQSFSNLEAEKTGTVKHNLANRAANMVFFKTSSGVLANPAVRQSLVQSANIPDIIKHLGYPTHAVREPFLLGQLGYDPAFAQSGFDLKAANMALQNDGWTKTSDGNYSKSGSPLTFTLSVANVPEEHLVASLLEKQWRVLGAKVIVQYLDSTDFQNALTYHNYDAIFNGISIGIDPDVFVYWDSSQADIRSTNRLNLSEYKNPIADAALESGRTRLDPSLRVIKYRPFLQAWQHDNPALGLYQPSLLYLTNGPVAGLDEHPISSALDRFANVQNWEIRQAKVSSNK